MSVRYLPFIITVPAAALFLAACSGSPEVTAVKSTVEQSKKNEPPPPPEAVPAMTAFWEMYKPAYGWAKDLLPLSLAANNVPGYKNQGGKAFLWTAVFVSPSQNAARTYYYSVVDSPVAPKGVTARAVQSWGGMTRDSRPFQTTQVAINSDAAYKTASEAAGNWLKKHPDKEASISLMSGARFPSPVWFIVWGDKKDGYVAYVNATTGNLMK